MNVNLQTFPEKAVQNEERPIPGLKSLNQFRAALDTNAGGQDHGPVRCRNVLGGISHDYYRDAA
jgi:hypothetical protein